MSEQRPKGPEHVAAGYKATIHNPNVSQEAKDHAWKELHKMGIHDLDQPIYQAKLDQSIHQAFEQPIHLVSTAPTGQHSAEAEVRVKLHHPEEPRSEPAIETQTSKNEGNVIGGYKAALKNPRVSKEAKQHAEAVLGEHGVDLGPYEEEIKEL